MGFVKTNECVVVGITKAAKEETTIICKKCGCLYNSDELECPNCANNK